MGRRIAFELELGATRKGLTGICAVSFFLEFAPAVFGFQFLSVFPPC